MTRIGKIVILALIFIISIQLVLSIDDVDKIYFQQQMEKLNAQYTAKLDSQTTRIESDMKTNFDTAKADIQSQMAQQIRSNLQAVAVGLAGIIIITLAIFKVIDLKISSTRNIKKYENLLQTKTEELNKLILSATMERNELALARQQLVEYQNKLKEWHQQILAGKVVATTEFAQQKPMSVPNLKGEDIKGKKPVIMTLIAILLIIIAGVMAYLYFFGK